MFKFSNLFRNDSVDDIIDAIKSRGPIDMGYTAPVQKDTSEALYKVGMNEDGMTQLTVGNSNSLGVTLTLNNASVVHLIKLLAVNIDDSYTVTVKNNSQEL